MELFNVLDIYSFIRIAPIGSTPVLTCSDVTSNMNNSSTRIAAVSGSPTTFDVSSYNTTSYFSQSITQLPPLYTGNDCYMQESGRGTTVSIYPTYRGGQITDFGRTRLQLIGSINTARSSWASYMENFLTYESSNYSFITPTDNIEQYVGKKILLGGQLYTFSISNVTSDYRLVYGSITGSVTSGKGEYRYVNGSEAGYIRDLGNNISIAVASSITTASTGRTYQYDSPGNAVNTAVIIRVVKKYVVTLTLYSTETLTTTMKSYSTRADTYDSPADFFIVPYGEVPFKVTSSGDTYTTNKERGIAIARAIATSFSDSCYDLQILPYCPSNVVQNLINTNGYLDLSALMSTMYSTVSSSVYGYVSFVLYPSSCTDTFDILKTMEIPNFGYSAALNRKISNETELYRLVSPNYNGQFEFSLAKNNGILKFNVDYTYKPFMSYIHINPDFKFMYGSDWDDARGLVCGGDFSLSFLTDAWTNYKLNNKNFQQMFDRQIQNMDVNNSIAREKQEFQATIGTITSGIGGALGGAAAGVSAGMMTGNPFIAAGGAIVGGLAGGVGSAMASAYGAEKDREWLKAQQYEARSYAIDMYGYQLGNIQAIPYSIKGSDVLINNYKIWPFIERYEATSAERSALVEKIKYNGMTIMIVGHIEDYCSSDDFDNVFIKGQLIKLESDDINDDFHIADAIYQEINKGVYIPSGGL